jgi:hypothetical protein
MGEISSTAGMRNGRKWMFVVGIGYGIAGRAFAKVLDGW